MPLSASLAIEPSEGTGAATPRPINDRKDSVIIALGTTPVADIMITPIELGSRWRFMTHLDFAPIASAASTYS